MLRRCSSLSRFLSKLFHELLPAALASVVGGILFNHYARPTIATPAATIQSPASAEMMQMLRDDHALMLNYMKRYDEARIEAGRAAAQAARLRTAEQMAAHAARKARAAEARALAIGQRAEAHPAKRLASRLPVRSAETVATAKPAGVGRPADVVPQAQQTEPPSAVLPAPPAPVANSSENPIVAGLRGAVAAVERLPLWIRPSADWLGDDTPPRPPVGLPERNFLSAAM